MTSFKEKTTCIMVGSAAALPVIEPAFFDLIAGDSTLLEREPLEKVSQACELMAYRHDGFWHCMDTKRDHELLESLWYTGAPWVV